MSAVFHPGHDELHGMTVVLSTSGPMTFVGRWEHKQNGLIVLNDAAMHEATDGGKTREVFLAEQKKYGVAVQHRQLTVPEASVSEVALLREIDVPEI